MGRDVEEPVFGIEIDVVVLEDIEIGDDDVEGRVTDVEEDDVELEGIDEDDDIDALCSRSVHGGLMS